MPPVSEAQRRLMWAAASKKGGVGGVSQAVGKDFAGADPGGKLPAHKDKDPAKKITQAIKARNRLRAMSTPPELHFVQDDNTELPKLGAGEPDPIRDD